MNKSYCKNKKGVVFFKHSVYRVRHTFTCSVKSIFNSRTPRTVCLCRMNVSGEQSQRYFSYFTKHSSSFRLNHVQGIFKSILYWWGKEAKRAGCEGHRRHCIWRDSDFRPQVKTTGPGIRIGVEANTIGLHRFYLFRFANTTVIFFPKIVLHSLHNFIKSYCSAHFQIPSAHFVL